jgi:hypothetical protein
MAQRGPECLHASGFDNLIAKIGWAYKHIQEFDHLAVEYCRSSAYAVTRYDDLVGQRHVIRCESLPVKVDIMLALSDVMYSLRSGLDQLAWQLALMGTPNPSREVMFPIHSDQSVESRRKFSKIVKHMPPDAITVIEDLQPYKRGAAYRDDPLWQLAELSNIDKHRVLVGRANIANLYIEPVGWTRQDLEYGVEISWPLSLKNAVVFKPNIPTLVFGDPLDSTKPVPLELTREEIVKIYSYVRADVAPRFAAFFSASPDP